MSTPLSGTRPRTAGCDLLHGDDPLQLALDLTEIADYPEESVAHPSLTPLQVGHILLQAGLTLLQPGHIRLHLSIARSNRHVEQQLIAGVYLSTEG